MIELEPMTMEEREMKGEIKDEVMTEREEVKEFKKAFESIEMPRFN